MLNQWVETQSAALILGVSVRAVQALLKRGRLESLGRIVGRPGHPPHMISVASIEHYRATRWEGRGRKKKGG